MTSDNPARLIGRSSSHFTRLARLFAEELGVPCTFAPLYELTSRDPADYGGNPALKLPVLQLPQGSVFGAENICRTLTGLTAQSPRTYGPSSSPTCAHATRRSWSGMA